MNKGNDGVVIQHRQEQQVRVVATGEFIALAKWVFGEIEKGGEVEGFRSSVFVNSEFVAEIIYPYKSGDCQN